jgi:hypothetical protein
MTRKTLFMERTDVPAERTAQEIHALLVEAGARQVLTEYNDKREITGIHFIMAVNNQQIPFKMPVRTEKLTEVFIRRAQKTGYLGEQKKEKIRDKAKRVAWRQLLRWIEAQLAFIDSGMAETAEVFMPYLQVSPQETLYQRAVTSGFERLALPATTE